MPKIPTLDHLVLPVHDLDSARRRLQALGFTVAPDGIHPFGTANACVYLADGTFLEPLVVADEAIAAEAIEADNVFVARDRAFRALKGDEGFSALVLASDDAVADHQRFQANDTSAGPVLEFSRLAVDPTGKADKAVFRLAFAAEAASPEPFVFTCQRVRSPKVDRAALQAHRNGVTRIKRVLATAANPEAHRDFWTGFLHGAEPAGSAGGYDWRLGNAVVSLRQPEALSEAFGVRAEGTDGMGFAAIVFGAAELNMLTGLFKADAISYEERNRSIIVPPATGQGTTFIFEAEQ